MTRNEYANFYFQNCAQMFKFTHRLCDDFAWIRRSECHYLDAFCRLSWLVVIVVSFVFQLEYLVDWCVCVCKCLFVWLRFQIMCSTNVANTQKYWNLPSIWFNPSQWWRQSVTSHISKRSGENATENNTLKTIDWVETTAYTLIEETFCTKTHHKIVKYFDFSILIKVCHIHSEQNQKKNDTTMTQYEYHLHPSNECW